MIAGKVKLRRDEEIMSNTNYSIINISEDEIKKYTQQIFTENHSVIIGKTDPFNGERCFVLCSLEQLI